MISRPTLRSELDRLSALPGARIYVRPLRAGCEVAVRAEDGTTRAATSVEELSDWAACNGSPQARRVEALLDRIAAPPTAFAGLPLDRPRLMGIVNVTPDSFSDGGLWLDPEKAAAHVHRLVEEGADIVDLGAESTRPGATPVDAKEEIRRLDPVLIRLDGIGAAISVDTRHSATMRHCIAAGASVVNDVSALTDDPDSLAVVAGSDASVFLMHKQGQPRTMNVAPAYDDVVLEVFDHLEARIVACEAAGIARKRIAVDPGIAFGKTSEHSMALLAGLSIFRGLGCPVLLGVSRKGLLGEADAALPPPRRFPGSLAAALWGLEQGVTIVRVHDVAETAQAFAVWRRIRDKA